MPTNIVKAYIVLGHGLFFSCLRSSHMRRFACSRFRQRRNGHSSLSIYIVPLFNCLLGAAICQPFHKIGILKENVKRVCLQDGSVVLTQDSSEVDVESVVGSGIERPFRPQIL